MITRQYLQLVVATQAVLSPAEKKEIRAALKADPKLAAAYKAMVDEYVAGQCREYGVDTDRQAYGTEE